MHQIWDRVGPFQFPRPRGADCIVHLFELLDAAMFWKDALAMAAYATGHLSAFSHGYDYIFSKKGE